MHPFCGSLAGTLARSSARVCPPKDGPGAKLFLVRDTCPVSLRTDRVSAPRIRACRCPPSHPRPFAPREQPVEVLLFIVAFIGLWLFIRHDQSTIASSQSEPIKPFCRVHSARFRVQVERREVSYGRGLSATRMDLTGSLPTEPAMAGEACVGSSAGCLTSARSSRSHRVIPNPHSKLCQT